MTTNFLGEVGELSANSGILSSSALIAREGIELFKGMNFRKDPFRCVFLVLEREDGFRDQWNPETGLYAYEGHDSKTVVDGKLQNQVLSYGDDRLSENGKFFKAAQEWVGGQRAEPLSVQVYEKLDTGAWFDKGMFDLMDAKESNGGKRKVFTFFLKPHGFTSADERDRKERMLPAAEKALAWRKAGGRCEECGTEMDLHFAHGEVGIVQLLCRDHSGRPARGLL